MSMKKAVLKQYQARIDKAAMASVNALYVPSEGWIATMRKALSMSGARLAKRLGQTRANVSNIERSELDGTPSLKTMQTLAKGMGCKFVYAIVPEEGNVNSLLQVQARKKAQKLVKQASTHMALEKQSLSKEQEEAELDRLTQELLREIPSDLWEDE